MLNSIDNTIRVDKEIDKVSLLTQFNSTKDRLNSLVIKEDISTIVPTLSDLNATISENSLSGSEVGHIPILDSGDSEIISISLSGDGHSNFTTDKNGYITIASDALLDYETTSQYNLTAIATNSAGNGESIDIIISIIENNNNINPFQIAKIQADDNKLNSYFGNSVDIDENYIIVGSRFELFSESENYTMNVGSAYLYKKDRNANINQIAKLQTKDIHNNNFGHSVSISGEYIVVSVPFEYIDGKISGSAYIFKIDPKNEDSITQIAKIRSDENQEHSFFGYSTSISGEYITIGAPFESLDEEIKGSVYLFKIDLSHEDNITQITKLQSDDDYFGSSVSISNKHIIVGNPLLYENEDKNSTGSASLFKINTNDVDGTIKIAEIQANDEEKDNYFGILVSIDNDYIVISSPSISHDINATDNGTVYLFKIEEDDEDDINSTTQIAKIKSFDAKIGDEFGSAISINRDYIVIGTSTQEENTGSTYI
ncbi:MAG: cadherin domain-containing protein, partial [Candidatus Cloacimonadota bacterium]|nr:cadherin domain-containing protein [Candidatus Cloacimonadota bacterium]